MATTTTYIPVATTTTTTYPTHVVVLPPIYRSMSRNPGAYKDLGKEANDFLNKNFLESEWKFELNTVAANGSTVKSSISKTDGGVFSSLETKCKHRGAEVTTVIDNNRDAKVTLAHKKVFAGLDTSIEVSSNANKLIEGLKVKGAVDYVHDVVTLNSNLTVPVGGNGATSSVSSVVLGSKEKGIALGAEVEVNAVRAQVTRFDTILTYSTGANSLAAFTRTKRDNTTNALAHRVGVNVFHKFNSPSNANVALESVYDLKTHQVTVAAAAGYHPDETTFVKGRLNNGGILSLAYTQILLAPFTVSTFANANLLGIEGPDAVKLGVKLTYQQ